MRSFIYTLLACLIFGLNACKTVQVMIPAQYDLGQEHAVVISDFSGDGGHLLSMQVLSTLQRKLPQTAWYREAPTGLNHAVVLHAQVEAFHMGQPHIQWDAYNHEEQQQYGSVHRDISMQVSAHIENEQHQVLWSHVFSQEQHISRSFAIPSDESYASLDGAEDVFHGKLLDGILDAMTAHDMEEDALHTLPSQTTLRQQMLQNMSMLIAQSFYARTEEHLEFR